jgi:ABC-type nitrate/sulfonate/bicarbonate transport system permease component
MTASKTEQRPTRARNVRTPDRAHAARLRIASSIAFSALSVVSFLLVWEAASRAFGLVVLFPPPTVTLRRFVELLATGELERAALISLLRIFAGFVVGSVLGAFLGLLMGSFGAVRAVAEPYVHFFRFVPPLAWFAPVLLWFGSGEGARVILIVYTTIFVVALNAMAGVAAVPRNKVRMARSFGASNAEVFRLVTLPACAPYIFTGMRIALGNSFMTIVVAEILGARDGLGYFVNSGVLFLDVPLVFSGVIALGLLGLLTDAFFAWLIRRYAGQFTPAGAAR